MPLVIDMKEYPPHQKFIRRTETDEWLEPASENVVAMFVEHASRIAELQDVLAPLLDHYVATYDGSMDALALKAAALVPDWKERADN